MRNEKILSICIPTYSRENDIQRQLRFILAEFEPYLDQIEILVSDNCSQDNTAKILQNMYQINDAFTYWVNKENIGMAGNFRELASKASGRYIWFIGDDDIITHGIADEIFNVFNKKIDVGLIVMNHNYFRGEYTEACSNPVIEFPQTGLYRNGIEIATDIFEKNNGFLMFITAVIIKQEYVKEVMKTCAKSLTANLTWALASASDKKGVFLINDSYIHDRCSDTSWNDLYLQVFAYDMTVSLKELRMFGYTKKQIKKLLRSRLNKYNNNLLIMYLFKNPQKGVLNYFNYLSLKLIRDTIIYVYKIIIKKVKSK